MAKESSSSVNQGIFKLVLGCLLIAVFFFPLYTSALFELTGPKILDFTQNGPDGKFQMVDDLTGFLMLFVPAFSVFIGCFAFGMGLFQVTAKCAFSLLIFLIPCFLNLLLGLICAYRLEYGVEGFFASLAPVAAWPFYLMLGMLALLGMGIPGFLGKQKA